MVKNIMLFYAEVGPVKCGSSPKMGINRYFRGSPLFRCTSAYLCGWTHTYIGRPTFWKAALAFLGVYLENTDPKQ